MRAWCLSWVLLGIQGCGAVYGSTHCDLRNAESPPRCQQRDGPMGGAFLAICQFTDGTPEDGPCPTEDQVAGCRPSEGGAQVVTDWYYRSTGEDAVNTPEDVRPLCEEDDAELVNP
jgi:hypothetical protein